MAGPAGAGAGGFLIAAGAIKAVVDEIKKIPDAVRGFVDALNPAAGIRLDFAFRSLYATIGHALEPVISTAAEVVRDFADAIGGGMTDLRDPVEAVASIFRGVLRPVLTAAGVALDGLARTAKTLQPLFELLGTGLQFITGMALVQFTVVSRTLLGILEAIVPSEQTLLGVTEGLTLAFVSLAETALKLSSFFLSLVGRQDIMRGILESLARDRTNDRRMGAPTNVRMSGLEDIIRERMLTAARGGGPDLAQQQVNLLAGLKKTADDMLKEMQAGNGGRARGVRGEDIGEAFRAGDVGHLRDLLRRWAAGDNAANQRVQNALNPDAMEAVRQEIARQNR